MPRCALVADGGAGRGAAALAAASSPRCSCCLGAAPLAGGARHVGEEARIVTGSQSPGGIRHGIEQRLEPGRVGLGEVMQHIAGHQVLGAGVADADTHAGVLVADVRRDRTQAVVPSVTAARLHAQLAGRQIEFVVEHQDVGIGDLEKTLRFLHRSAAVVHVGLRFQQDDTPPADAPSLVRP